MHHDKSKSYFLLQETVSLTLVLDSNDFHDVFEEKRKLMIISQQYATIVPNLFFMWQDHPTE